MQTITERRYISPEDLRSLCIRENWFTKGDNEAYAHLLGMCRTRSGSNYADLTTGLIAAMANSIQMHSAVEQSTEYLLNIMFCIAQASTTYFDIEE